MHGLVRALVEEAERVGDVRGGDDVRDQRLELEPTLHAQVDHRLLQTGDRPALGEEPRGDVRDLGRDELDAIVVELLAEAEAGRVALLEAGGDDTGRVGSRANRLVQRGGRAGQLDDDVCAAAVRELLDRLGDGLRGRVDDDRRAELPRQLEPTGDPVDCDDGATVQARELRRDQPRQHPGRRRPRSRRRGHPHPAQRSARPRRCAGTRRRAAASRRAGRGRRTGPREGRRRSDGPRYPRRRRPARPRSRPRRPTRQHRPARSPTPRAGTRTSARRRRRASRRSPTASSRTDSCPVCCQLGAGGDSGVERPHEHLTMAGRPLLVLDERDVTRGAEGHHPLGHW